MRLDAGSGPRVRALVLVMTCVAVGGCAASSVAPTASAGPGASGPASVGTASAAPVVNGQGAASSGVPTMSPSIPSRSVPRVSLPPATVDLAAVPAAVVAAVLADATGRTGVASGSITFVRAEAVTWPSGALGCPEPGRMYTDALVQGYWLVVAAGGTQLDYRATQSGAFKVCPGPGQG